MARDTDEASETVTRKPDDTVGSSGSPAAGGGRQTQEQAAITDMGTGGKSDPERTSDWKQGGEPGRAPPTPGGSSEGHSDQKASRGPNAGETVADGLYKAEREAADERS